MCSPPLVDPSENTFRRIGRILLGRRGGTRYAEIAKPFEWTLTRLDLEPVLAKNADREPEPRLAA